MNTLNISRNTNLDHRNLNGIRNNSTVNLSIQILHETKENGRNIRINLNNHEVYTPLIIPSISSVRGSLLHIKEMIDFLEYNRVPAILASLYDMTNTDIMRYKDISNNSIFVADSGGFEIKTLYNSNQMNLTKKWQFCNYIRVAEIVEPDIILSFDPPYISEKEKIAYAIKTSENIKNFNFSKNTLFEYILSNELLYSDLSKILHFRKVKRLINLIMSEVKPQLIGIPNQCLGPDIIHRSDNLRLIVKYIRKKFPNLLLHILGCGNPEEIRIYSKFGADIFDSTLWYRNYIDRRCQEEDYIVIEENIVYRDCSCRHCVNTDFDKEKLFRVFLKHNFQSYIDLLSEIDIEIKEGCIKCTTLSHENEK